MGQIIYPDGRRETLGYLNASDGVYTASRDDGNGKPVTDVHFRNAYNDKDDMMKIQSLQKKWKDSFSTPANALNTQKWDLVQQGTNQNISVTNGVLTITSGVTANAETILMTKETFSNPFRALFGFMVSAKNVNTDVVFEAVSVNPETGELDGQNTVAWRISGSDIATDARAAYITKHGNVPELVIPSASIGNSLLTYSILELELFSDEAWYHSRAMDSPSGRASSFVRHQQIPDPNAIFKIRIRVANRATAPTVSTTLSMQFVTVIDYAELTAEITAGRGNMVAGQAMAMTPVGGTIATVSNITTANTVPKVLAFPETTANILTTTPFLGTARDASATPTYLTYRLRIFADQPLKVEVFTGASATLTSNRVQQTITVPANTMVVEDIPLVGTRYVGIRATNTGTANTTVCDIMSLLIADIK